MAKIKIDPTTVAGSALVEAASELATTGKVKAGKVAVAAATEVASEAAQTSPLAAALVQLFGIVKLLHENPHQKLEDHVNHPDFVGTPLHQVLGK